jgi:hypothetical protein
MDAYTTIFMKKCKPQLKIYNKCMTKAKTFKRKHILQHNKMLYTFVRLSSCLYCNTTSFAYQREPRSAQASAALPPPRAARSKIKFLFAIKFIGTFIIPKKLNFLYKETFCDFHDRNLFNFTFCTVSFRFQ